jgi:hypothetical protein
MAPTPTPIQLCGGRDMLAHRTGQLESFGVDRFHSTDWGAVEVSGGGMDAPEALACGAVYLHEWVNWRGDRCAVLQHHCWRG